MMFIVLCAVFRLILYLMSCITLFVEKQELAEPCSSDSESDLSSDDQSSMRTSHVKMGNFMGIVDELSPGQFKAHFRLSAGTTEKILQALMKVFPDNDTYHKQHV